MANGLSEFLKDTGELRDSFKNTPSSPLFIALTNWVNERMKEAKHKLEESGRVGSGALGNSIRPNSEVADNKVIVQVLANDYWDYINSGVNGVSRSFGSPYSFKNLGVGPQMKKSFGEFIKTKGINSLTYNDKDGNRITKMLQTAQDYESASYVLARATKKKGIEPSHFIDETFSPEAFKELSEILGKTIAATIIGK